MYLYSSPPSLTSPTSNSFKHQKPSLPLIYILPTGNMKLSSQTRALILLFIILVSSSRLSARLLLTKQGQDKVNYQVGLEGGETVDELMGMENCNNGDEECFKRRVISEAHLDYIYTQQHKP